MLRQAGLEGALDGVTGYVVRSRPSTCVEQSLSIDDSVFRELL
jgi:hypothetical protein